MDSQRYSVEAKVPRGTTKAQFHQMLQNLLGDRFQLVLQHEAAVLSVYELTVGKNGPKLKESPVVQGDIPPAPLAPRGVRDAEGFAVLPGAGLIAAYGPGTVCHLKAREQTISELLLMVSVPNGTARPIIDKTGLAGKYDFTLYYAFEVPGASLTTEASDPAPGLFDAIQQQLGLKLVSGKASFDRILIYHADKIPIEN